MLSCAVVGRMVGSVRERWCTLRCSCVWMDERVAVYLTMLWEQACGNGVIVVRWSMTGLDGSLSSDTLARRQSVGGGLHTSRTDDSSSANSNAATMLLWLEVIDNGPGYGDGVDPKTLFRPLYLGSAQFQGEVLHVMSKYSYAVNFVIAGRVMVVAVVDCV